MASERQSASNDLADRLAAARRDVEANVQRLRHTRSQLMATRERLTAGRAEREILHQSAFARLAARLDSQPVIEQAKGILIAQVGCTPDEAFTMLRTASQRTNVRIRDLARDIVERTASRNQTDGQPGQAVRQPSADHHPG